MLSSAWRSIVFGTSKFTEIKMAFCRSYQHWLHPIVVKTTNFNAANYQDLNTITTRTFQYMAASYHSPVLIVTYDISIIGSNEIILHMWCENNLCRTIRKCYVPTSYKFRYRGPVKSSHKWPVTRKMFPFDDVIMLNIRLIHYPVHETVTI